ncbi:MAG: Gfo/Idh/MocA family oxidoreductase [Bifidobacteriaceae bacterium]|jgi:predicted dehydrogenase|nr:Gfo/Idh/MocA family oxidoreductase [Bifidobacteriaceae bacterium]
MAEPRIRLGIIGLGLIAQAVHLPNLHRLRDVFDVVQVADLSARLAAQMAAEWGIPAWTTSAEAVFANPSVDAVLLLTPGTHADLATQAIAAGKHVLAEKPFANTRRECTDAAALAASNGLILQVGYMKMYEPMVPHLVRALDQLGSIRLVRVTVLHPSDEAQFDHHRYLRYDDVDPAVSRAAADREAATVAQSIGDVGEPLRSLFANVLQGSVCHEFSLLRAVFGQARLAIVHAQMGSDALQGQALSAPPQIQGLGKLGEAQFLLSWNWLPDYPEYGEELAVFGSAGRAYLRLPAPYVGDSRAHLRIETADGAQRVGTDRLANHETAFVAELRAFAAAVRDGAPVTSTADGAAWDVAGLQALTGALAGSVGAVIGGEAAHASPQGGAQ